MNRLFLSLALIFFLVGSVGATTGCFERGCDSIPEVKFGQTLIWGKITDASSGSIVTGASVEVICNGHVQHTTTGPYGFYWSIYSKNDCGLSDTVTVNTQKDALSGSQTQGVNDWAGIFINMERVNVALVPEFGFYIGLLTILSAVCIFFYVRKN